MYVLVLCCSVLFLCSLIVDREPHSFWQRVLSQPSHPLLATLKFLDVTPLLLPVGKTGHSSKVSPQNAAHYYHTYLQLLLPPRETQVDELSCNPLLLRVSATYVRIKPLAAASGTSNRLAALISRYLLAVSTVSVPNPNNYFVSHLSSGRNFHRCSMFCGNMVPSIKAVDIGLALGFTRAVIRLSERVTTPNNTLPLPQPRVQKSLCIKFRAYLYPSTPCGSIVGTAVARRGF